MKKIGKFVASPRLSTTTEATLKDATIVDDVVAFHGAKLKVQVHRGYRSRIRGRSFDIAAGRQVILTEGDVEVWIGNDVVSVRFKKRKKGQKPPYGSFLSELPKRVLKKFPVIVSYDDKDILEGVKVFLDSARKKASR